MKDYEFMSDYFADRENLGFPHVAIVSGMTTYLTGEDTFEVKDNLTSAMRHPACACAC